MRTQSLGESPLAIKKEVWSIGVPAIIESLFTTMTSIIDTKMVSTMGVTAISAVSVTNQPRLFVFSLFFAMNTSVSALVARCLGRKDRKQANELFVLALTATILLCVLLSVFCVIAAEPIMEVCSGQRDTMAMSVSYYRIVMGGMLCNILFMLINAALRGCGYTKITMQTNIVSSLVNIVFNYLLINGRFGFPRLGIQGAAVATVLGTAVAMGMSVVKLFNQSYYVNVRYILSQRIRPTRAAFRELMSMWKNICMENLLTRVGFLLTSMMSARIGSFDMSISSIGMTLMNISFAFGDGLQSASVALVGRSAGEKNVDKVRSYTAVIQKSGLCCAMVIGLIYAVLGNWYYSFFSADPVFIRKGAILCVIIALIGPIQISQIIFNGVLKCMNCTKQTLWAAIVSVTLVNPIANYLFAFGMHMGLWGIWLGTFLSQLCRLLILLRLYKKYISQLGTELS